LRALVTGGSGFLGLNLLNELSKSGNLQITCVSRRPQKNSRNIDWIQGNLADKNLLSFLKEQKFSKLYHLAWDGLPNRSAELSKINLYNSKELINNLVAKKNVELNVIGSCLEYGNIKGFINEESSPNGVDSFAQAKIDLNKFVSGLGVPYRWYRPFFVYGLGQNKDALIPSVVSSLREKKPIKLKSISNSHDFVSVIDIARAITVSSQLGTIFGEINIGTGISTAVGEIVAEIHKQFNLDFKEEFQINPGLVSSPGKLKKIAGWKPGFSGIAGIMKYYNSLGGFN